MTPERRFEVGEVRLTKKLVRLWVNLITDSVRVMAVIV